MYIRFKCTFKTNVHSKWMYIQNECTFCITMIMFATFCVLLPHCGHVYNILIMIATLWACLPHFDYDCHTGAMFATFYFEYDCHTVGMFAMFWVWLQYCSHVFHILSIITILFACLPCFEHDCHTVAMFNTFWLRLPHFCHICHIFSMIAIL